MSVETSFLIAIAVLACVFGVEIAGIAILVSKMRHARRERAESELPQNDGYSTETGSQMAVAALMFGAVPMSAQIALLTLAICTAVGAGVFVLLLVIYYAKGYALAARTGSKAEEPADAPEEAPVAAETEFPVADAVSGVDESEEYIGDIFADEPVDAPETVYAAADEEQEAVAEEPAEQPEVSEAPVAEEAPVAVVRREETAAVPNGVPVYSSAYPVGQMPVIEKHITETYREVIKETNTTTTTTAGGEQQYSPATEEILKAIAELMKLGTQLRMEKEMVVENPAVAKDDSTPVFAEIDEDEHEADEPEEDELDAEDAAEAREDAGENDGDDEYDSDLFGNGERIVGFDEETGCYIVARYRKSFEAKLIQARPEVKKYYSEIKNALLSYEGNKDRISWTINSYSNEHTQIAKINVRNRTLDLYLALDPATLEDSAYHGRDVGEKKKYAETPFLFKVNSPRKLTLALELVQRTCEEQGLSPIDIEAVSYEEQYPFESTEDLVRRGLIREYLREEKPAATFELAPDHAPELPEEDGSVIPANANFTWELADEQPEPVEEAEPVVEPEPEPAPAPEPVVEAPAPAPVAEAVPASTTVTTSHETVKTTERHYTERYIGGMPAQQTEYTAELTESTPPVTVIEAEAEPVEEPVEETVEEAVEEPVEETVDEPVEEAVAEESYEEEPEVEADEEIAEEEVYEEAEAEEYYEEEPEVEADEEIAEEVYEEAEAEEYYEEEPEAEEYYEEEPEAEEYYEEEPEAEEYYEEDVEYEAEEGEYAEYVEEEDAVEYEEEEEAEEEAPAPTPAPAAPAEDPTVARLDICVLDGYFENGAIVNLETLKQVGLVSEEATTLKLYASGSIKGRYTVEANHFTIDAVRAIRDADGESFVIR